MALGEIAPEPLPGRTPPKYFWKTIGPQSTTGSPLGLNTKKKKNYAGPLRNIKW